MIAAGRKIVIHFHHSTAPQEQLHKIQKELNLPEHKLVQDISTRWNFTFYMLSRLLEQKRYISLYLIDSHISNLSAA